MRALAGVVVCAWVAAACASGAPTSLPSTVVPTTVQPSPSLLQSTTIGPAASRYLEDFEFVWTTIDEEFYDPGFGGEDWAAIGDRFLPLIENADSDEAFVEVVNEMLSELDVSHLFVVPADAGFIDPPLILEGELGIHVRLVDGDWVMTEVESGSPAAGAGLRAGYALDSITGRPVADIAAAAPMLPPVHERGRRSSQILAVEELLYGEPGSVVTVGYRDAADEPDQATLAFAHRGPSAELIPGFPPVFTTLDVARLDGGIGYIRFEPFVPALAPQILDAIDTMRDAPGLIIDVRGNHGGNSEVGLQVISSLVGEPTAIWTWQSRDGSATVYTDPVDRPYDGPVVVLVDIISGSAAEAFAGGLQAARRGVVVGERTAGRLLGGEIVELPIGAIMIYPVIEPVLADGTTVEGRGVIPDIPVTVTRSDLLATRDPVLRAGIMHLQSLAD